MARISQLEANRPERLIYACMNVETNNKFVNNLIPPGTPLILNLTSTPQPSTAGDGFGPGYQDGLQVILASSANATQNNWFQFGVSLGNIAQYTVGEVLIQGVGFVNIVVGTRAATTNPWTSTAGTGTGTFTLASGIVLSPDTVNNGFSSGTAAGPPVQYPVILLDAVSVPASGITATGLTAYQQARAFVKYM